MPFVWGASGLRHYNLYRDAEIAFDVVMAHYQVIADSLLPENAYEAIFKADLRAPEHKLHGNWIHGFMESLDVAPEGWAVLQPSLDEDAFASLELLKVLYEIDIGESPLPLERQKTLYAEGPELISACVIELNRFTMTMDPKRSRRPPRAL